MNKDLTSVKPALKARTTSKDPKKGGKVTFHGDKKEKAATAKTSAAGAKTTSAKKPARNTKKAQEVPEEEVKEEEKVDERTP